MTKPQEIRLETFLEYIIELHQKHMLVDENISGVDIINILGNRSAALREVAVEALDILGEVWPEQEEDD